MDPRVDLAGRVALVTGASRGIGRAIALALAGAGADVVVNCRERVRSAEEAADAVRAEGRRALAIAADVSDARAVEEMVRSAEAELGPVDVLVNNAGVAIPRDLDELTEEEFDRTLAVNLKGAFLCARAVLPGMRARRWGRIVNISSGAARGAGVIGAHYNASKAGLEGLTRGYAARVAKDGVTVNAVLAVPDRDGHDRRPAGRVRQEGPDRPPRHARRSGASRADGRGERVHDGPDRPGERRPALQLGRGGCRMAGRLMEGDAALVTGAASGIGRAIAEALAREGAEVVLADNDAERGRGAAEALAAAGHAARFLEADLAVAGAGERLLEAALREVGRLSILVHSASPRRSEAETALSVSAEAWERMVAVNLRAGFELGRGAGRHMAGAGLRGRILFVTSLHAETPRNLPHYSAAKAGLTMTMKELARALGPHGIRVNAIAPGAVAGGGFQADPGLADRIPLGRLGRPEDVAAMALALLSERFAGYVTGTTVVVDGGLGLHNWIAPPPSA